MNGAWRRQINLGGQNNATFPGQEILLKTAPPGIELLKDGFTVN